MLHRAVIRVQGSIVPSHPFRLFSRIREGKLRVKHFVYTGVYTSYLYLIDSGDDLFSGLPRTIPPAKIFAREHPAGLGFAFLYYYYYGVNLFLNRLSNYLTRVLRTNGNFQHDKVAVCTKPRLWYRIHGPTGRCRGVSTCGTHPSP